MITFQQTYTEVAAGCGIELTDTTKIQVIKRHVNTAIKLFKSPARQYFTKREVVTDLIANQQYYTLGVDCIRPRNVRINNGSLIFPIPSIESEMKWNQLNVIPNFAIFYPQKFFVRGNNEIGVWPIPSQNIAGALILSYDARLEDMYLDDVVGASVTVTNSSVTITSSTNSFLPSMVGMKLGFTDGSNGNWHTIVGYTNAATMTIENFYDKPTQTTTGTIIGSCFDIPEEYQESLQYYPFWQYYMNQRKDAATAANYKGLFIDSRNEYVGTFADKESGQIILPQDNIIPYNPLLVPPTGLSG